LYSASFCFCTLHLLCSRERKTKLSFLGGLQNAMILC
jgi:hypothetical protein